MYRWFALSCLIVVTAAGTIHACPFCTALSQTLRQEMKQMDAVGIALRIAAQSDSVSTFEIGRILKGKNLIAEKQQVDINFFGQADPQQKFLVMAIDPPDLLWSSPLALSEKAIEYLDHVRQLPEDNSQARLEFYLQHINDADPVLSRDVYDEFASASFSDMLLLKDRYNRDDLLAWIQDLDISPDRRRLYLVMLGICGKKEDALLLEKLLRSEDPNQRSGLDALISCYVSLYGEEGLKLINDLYLRNAQSSYADTYAAIMALRFHGTEGGVVERQRVVESLRLILDRPELADLVIPDLARWEDWEVMDKLADLYKKADEKSSWVRVPVINYLRSCPLPQAAELLDQLKEIDPVAFKRATQFFPIPQPAAEESSSLDNKIKNRGVYSDHVQLNPSSQPIASSSPMSNYSSTSNDIRSTVNPVLLGSVLATIGTSIWLSMWLAISGAGRRSMFIPQGKLKNRA